jgi:hypothetical protein
MTLTETGLITITTMGFALLTLIVRYCYKSKCEDFQVVGCLKIHRNVNDELKNDEFENNHTQSSKEEKV